MTQWLRSLRTRAVHSPTVAAGVMIASGLMFAGGGIGAGYLYGSFPAQWIDGRGTVYNGGLIANVGDEDIIVGAVVGAASWLIFLLWMFAPAIRFHRGTHKSIGARTIVLPIIGTVLIAIVVSILGAGMDYPITLADGSTERRFDDSEYFITAMALFGGGLAVVLWLPIVCRLAEGRAVEDRSGCVNVNCPSCGYAMNGLKSTTCPECGTDHQLDVLIKAQGYGADTPEPVSAAS